MEKKGQAIPREDILKAIGNNFQQMIQWSRIPDNMLQAGKYATRAEMLIELLEVADCGAVGGFDKGQRKRVTEIPSMFDRWEWLYQKYNDPEDVTFGRGVTFEDIREWILENRARMGRK